MEKRTKPLPKHEDRFDRFYIRYDIWNGAKVGSSEMKTAVDAEVWKVNEFRTDGTPEFYLNSPLTPEEVKPDFTILVKWDGATHIFFSNALEFSGLEEDLPGSSDSFEGFTNLVKYIYNDICDRADLID